MVQVVQVVDDVVKGDVASVAATMVSAVRKGSVAATAKAVAHLAVAAVVGMWATWAAV